MTDPRTRAIYFTTYLQEEIYGNDISKMQVAPTCSGTRTGLRGQVGRCTLEEFCDYIWKQTGKDTHPKGRAIWPPAAKDLDKLNAESITRLVDQQIKEYDAKKKKNVAIKGLGYTGNSDGGKLMPNAGVGTFCVESCPFPHVSGVSGHVPAHG